jgi:hypothetical protein
MEANRKQSLDNETGGRLEEAVDGFSLMRQLVRLG